MKSIEISTRRLQLKPLVSIYFEKGMGELGWIVNKKYWGNRSALQDTYEYQYELIISG